MTECHHLANFLVWIEIHVVALKSLPCSWINRNDHNCLFGGPDLFTPNIYPNLDMYMYSVTIRKVQLLNLFQWDVEDDGFDCLYSTCTVHVLYTILYGSLVKPKLTFTIYIQMVPGHRTYFSRFSLRNMSGVIPPTPTCSTTLLCCSQFITSLICW